MKCDLCGCWRSDLAHYCLDALKEERNRYKAALEKVVEHHAEIAPDMQPGDRCEHPWFGIAQQALESAVNKEEV